MMETPTLLRQKQKQLVEQQWEVDWDHHTIIRTVSKYMTLSIYLSIQTSVPFISRTRKV